MFESPSVMDAAVDESKRQAVRGSTICILVYKESQAFARKLNKMNPQKLPALNSPELVLALCQLCFTSIARPSRLQLFPFSLHALPAC